MYKDTNYSALNQMVAAFFRRLERLFLRGIGGKMGAKVKGVKGVSMDI